VLHDIFRRILLKQPAGKGPTPCVFLLRYAAFVDDELHENTDVRVRFPRLRPFARTHADDQFITNAKSLTGFQFNIARVSITFVEQANNRDSLRHGRAGHLSDDLRRSTSRLFGRRLRLFFGRIAPQPAGRQEQGGCRHETEMQGPCHPVQTPSGDQAS
jgi:hypothetical protein